MAGVISTPTLSKAMTARSASAWAWDFSARSSAMRSLKDKLVVDIGHSLLDRVIEPFQSNLGFGRLLAQLDRVSSPALGPLLAAIRDNVQDLLQPLGIEQPFFQTWVSGPPLALAAAFITSSTKDNDRRPFGRP